MSFRELAVRETIESLFCCEVAHRSAKPPQTLNAAYSAENSRLIAEHGSAGICLEQTRTRLGAGRTWGGDSTVSLVGLCYLNSLSHTRKTLFQCKMSLNGGIDSQYKMSLKG
jgi:hypothetical protein